MYAQIDVTSCLVVGMFVGRKRLQHQPISSPLSCACQTGSNGEHVLDHMMRILGRIEGVIQESLMCLKNLQDPNYPCPHLVVVNEVETQGERGLLTTVRDIAVKDMTMNFL